MGEARLRRHRPRIVDARRDPPLAEMVREGVAPFRADGELVIGVNRVLGIGRERHRCFGEGRPVPRREHPALLGPRAQSPELGAEERGLQGVQPGVRAQRHVRVVSRVAVDPEKPRARCDRVILGEDRAAVPQAAEILRREEAQRGRGAPGSDRAAFVARADRLGGVLQQRDRTARREIAQRLEMAGEPVEMHRHDRARSRRDRRFRRARIHPQALGLHVHEDGTRAQGGHRARAREVREGGNDHLVVGPDPERQKRDGERRRSGGHADGVGDAARLRQLALEGIVLGSEDELPRAEHALEISHQLRHERPVHGAQIEKRNGRSQRGLHGTFAVARAITTGRWPVRSTCCWFRDPRYAGSMK